MMSVSYLFHQRAGSFSVLFFITVSAASTKPNTCVVVSTHLRSDNDWMDASVKSGGSNRSTGFQPWHELATNKGTKKAFDEGEGGE